MKAASSRRARTRRLPPAAVSTRGSPSCSFRIRDTRRAKLFHRIRVLVKFYVSDLRRALFPPQNSPANSRPPTHLVNGPAGDRIVSFAGDDKSALAVESDGARIVDIDIEVETARR